MTMEDRIKSVLGEQSYIITALQVQLDAAKRENEILKGQLAEFSQGMMFSEQIVPPRKPNGDAHPDV